MTVPAYQRNDTVYVAVSVAASVACFFVIGYKLGEALFDYVTGRRP